MSLRTTTDISLMPVVISLCQYVLLRMLTYKTTMWNGELFCVVLAIVDEERLFIRRIDFQEWEMNRRDGTVECTYVFDKENTSKLCGLLHAQTTADLFKLLKSKFGFRTKDYIFLQNMEDYCMANNIVYHSSVWY